MRFLVCPDSFKGSLSSVEAADAIVRGIRIGASSYSVVLSEAKNLGVVAHTPPRVVLSEAKNLDPGELISHDAPSDERDSLEIVSVPLADGGEGTVEALVRATGGEIRRVMAHDPLGREIESFYGILGDGKTAVVEAAAASGLTLLSESERNPLIASTFGTGELILAAAKSGVERVIVGLGGSATNDAGAGAMAALGAKFLDSNGNELPPGGGALADLDRIDMSGFAFPEGVRVVVACDVTNPLVGPTGASVVFGPQKGATRDMVRQLDAALVRWAEVVRRDLGKEVINLPGAGAAGGLGAAMAAFLDAELRSGIDIVLDAVRFDDLLKTADLVITGEGKIDEQTSFGKAIGGVLKRASAAGVPVVAVAGSCAGDLRPLYDAGLTAAFSIAPGPMTVSYSMAHASELLISLAANIARFFIAKPIKDETTKP